LDRCKRGPTPIFASAPRLRFGPCRPLGRRAFRKTAARGDSDGDQPMFTRRISQSIAYRARLHFLDNQIAQWAQCLIQPRKDITPRPNHQTKRHASPQRRGDQASRPDADLLASRTPPDLCIWIEPKTASPDRVHCGPLGHERQMSAQGVAASGSALPADGRKPRTLLKAHAFCRDTARSLPSATGSILKARATAALAASPRAVFVDHTH